MAYVCIVMNTFKTSILLAGLTALLLAAGILLGGEGGFLIAVGFALFGNIFAYWSSDKMVLSMYGARQVDETSHPAYVGTVKQLAARAQLPMPKVYVIDTPQPNAFATGRDPENAAVAATTGLLDNMSYQEIAGVMAHELAHVKSRDTLIMTITASLAGALTMLATFAMFFGGRSRNSPLGSLGNIVVMMLAPMAAMLVQMAISRTREYQADRLGAEICGQPLWLASALEKLERLSHRINNDQAENNPATAHLFIINPLHLRKVDNLFSTHPKTSNRVKYLRDMAATFPKITSSSRPWG